jgi:serine/threonine protein kinase
MSSDDMIEEKRCNTCGTRYLPDLIDGTDNGCPKCLADFLQDGTEATLGIVTETDSLSSLTIGTTIGEYEILELLGRGGMGSVYKASQKKLDRIVALKVLDAKLASSKEFTSRFGREAKALALLNHPNVVQIFDYGHDGDRYYLVMEYVEGASLRHVMDTQKLGPEAALRYVRQICDALDYAHSEGIIHRDVKPDNILIDKHGNLKVADFGLAKIATKEGETPVSLVTQADRVMGTPNYMAPEQRLQTSSVDHRADIFSLGVVFYEMLTGNLPMGSFPPPSQSVQVNVHLDEVVLKAMNTNPELRYQRVSEIKQDVTENNSTTIPRSENVAEHPGKLAKLSLLGLFLLPWGLPVVLEIFWAFRQSATSGFQPFLFSPVYHNFFYPLGVLAAVAATLVGWKALEQIHSARGALAGRSLAVISLLTYPILSVLVFTATVFPELITAFSWHNPQNVFAMFAEFTARENPAAVIAGTVALVTLILVVRSIRSAVRHDYTTGLPGSAITMVVIMMFLSGIVPLCLISGKRMRAKIIYWEQRSDVKSLLEFVVSNQSSEKLQVLAISSIFKNREWSAAREYASLLLPVIDDESRDPMLRSQAVLALGDPLPENLREDLKKRVYNENLDDEVRAAIVPRLGDSPKNYKEFAQQRDRLPPGAVWHVATELLACNGIKEYEYAGLDDLIIELLENPRYYNTEDTWSKLDSLLFHLGDESVVGLLQQPARIKEALATMEGHWLNSYSGLWADYVRDEVKKARGTLEKVIAESR